MIEKHCWTVSCDAAAALIGQCRLWVDNLLWFILPLNVTLCYVCLLCLHLSTG